MAAIAGASRRHPRVFARAAYEQLGWLVMSNYLGGRNSKPIILETRKPKLSRIARVTGPHLSEAGLVGGKIQGATGPSITAAGGPFSCSLN